MIAISILAALVLLGLAFYLLYMSGTLKDLEILIKTEYAKIKFPVIKLPKISFPKIPWFDRNIITKPNADKMQEERLRYYQAKEIYQAKQQVTRHAPPAPPPSRLVPEGYIPNMDVGRSSMRGQQLTKWEISYLWDGISKRKRVPCFHCFNEDMYSGFQDGNVQMWYCPNCGQGISLVITKASQDGISGANYGVEEVNKR